MTVKLINSFGLEIDVMEYDTTEQLQAILNNRAKILESGDKIEIE